MRLLFMFRSVNLSRACYVRLLSLGLCVGVWVDSRWNVMAHGEAREGKWSRNRRMQWISSTLHTTSERGESSITTADAHTSAASSRLNWRPCRFKWTRPFRRKTKSGFCACAITFKLASTLCELVPGHLIYNNCQHSASIEQSSSEWKAYGVRLLNRI